MIIGISGKISSGKDLIGNIIQYMVAYKRAGYNHGCSEEDFKRFIANKHHMNSTWKIVKFADKLKDMTCILLGCTREDLENTEFKNKELGEEWWYYRGKRGPMRTYMSYNRNVTTKGLYVPTPRTIMQHLGTEAVRRNIHENAWVNATMRDYNENSKWIITDMRFPNELKAVEQREGITIRVTRHDDDFVSEEHESETALDNYMFDYNIKNDGTIEDLIYQVEYILTREKII